MGRRQPQYVMVTKQRRKSGCLAGFFHLIGGMFTLGMWPALVWLSHRLGPKRKQVAHVYGPPPQQPPVQYYGLPQPQQPPQQPLTPEEQWRQWLQPPNS